MEYLQLHLKEASSVSSASHLHDLRCTSTLFYRSIGTGWIRRHKNKNRGACRLPHHAKISYR